MLETTNKQEQQQQTKKLTILCSSSVALNEWSLLEERVSYFGRGNDWLRLENLKGFVDGSLGSHTAWMTEPYVDVERNASEEMRFGFPITTPDNLYRWAKAADSAQLRGSRTFQLRQIADNFD